MLGRETILVRTAHGASAAAGVSIDSDAARVLALLCAAYGRPVADHAIAKMRRAMELWQEGEKALAQFHLAFIGLPDADEAVVFRLSLALKLLESGVSPGALLKGLGYDRLALDLEKYNPDQPRAPAGSGRESGQWTSGDSGPGISSQGQLPRNRQIEIVHVRVAGAIRSDANPPGLVPGAQYAQVSPTPIITQEKIEEIIRKHGPSAPSEKGKFVEEYLTEEGIRTLIEGAWAKATFLDVAAGRWRGGVVIAGSVFVKNLVTGEKTPYTIGTSGIRDNIASVETNTYVVVLDSNMNVKTCYPINPADEVNPREE